jgi:hypothetical protein
VGVYSFNHCSALTAIDVNGSNMNYASVNGTLYNKAMTALVQFPSGKAGSFIIPNGVTQIGNSAFSYSHLLTSVIIPGSVTSMGWNAFSSCDHLTSVTMSAGVLSIGYSAFSYCANLTSVTIPAGVTSIGNFGFYYCASLTSIAIPASVTSIGDNAFYGCSALAAIDVNPGNPIYASQNGVLFNKTLTALIQCPGGKAGSFTIPNGVTEIAKGAFSRCHLLVSVTVPGTISILGDQLFQYCTALSSVTLPSGLKAIGNSTFYGCSNLSSINIPAGVEYIGSNAFANCYALSYLSIPGAVKTIETSAFYDCTSLTGIDVSSSNTNYASFQGVLYNKAITTLIQYPIGRAGEFTVPSNVATIAESAFADSPGLTSVTVPDSVLRIEASAFAYCHSLKSINVVNGNPNYASVDGVLYDKGVNSLIQFPSGRLGAFVIPSSVTKIGDSSFYWCNLTRLEVPTSVSAIGNWSFGNCRLMTEIRFDGNAPDLGDHWLYAFNTSLKIYYASGASGFTSPTWFGAQTVVMYPVTGRVVDSDGKGLANIIIALENGVSVKTAANGDFVILVAAGQHTLTVSGAGIDRHTVEVILSDSGLSLGNISTVRSGDTMIPLLIAILAIAMVLVVVFVLLIRRNKSRRENVHSATVPSPSAPAVGTTTQPKNCPYCGTERTDAPFCGNCGKKLG